MGQPRMLGQDDIYRGDTVMFSSLSRRVPLRSCCRARRGHTAPCPASLRARGTSMMISFSTGFFSWRTTHRYSRPTEPM